jgi:hypothetical protein
MSPINRGCAVEVLEVGHDNEGAYRRVRLADGAERIQRPHVTVEGAVARADGSTDTATITNVNIAQEQP